MKVDLERKKKPPDIILYFAGSTKKKKVRKHAEMQHYDNKKKPSSGGLEYLSAISELFLWFEDHWHLMDEINHEGITVVSLFVTTKTRIPDT